MARQQTKAASPARNSTSFTAALAEVMAEVGYVQKDGTNTFHKYKYASAEAVLKKVNAALSSRGICIESQAELLNYVPAPKGESCRAVVLLRLAFRQGDNTCIATGIGEGSDKGDKAVLKANTSALKYALANAFLISWGDDPEADAGTDAEAEAKPPKKAPRKPRTKKDTAPTEDLAAAIKSATSEEALVAAGIKPKIRALREDDPDTYAALRDAYTARVEQFKKEG